MSRRSLWFLFAALVPLAALLLGRPATPQQRTAPLAASPAPAAEGLVLHGARIADGIVYLPVKVAGAGPFPFVLDTGAGPQSAVDSGLADSLDLGARPLTEAGGAGEERVPFGALAGVELALGPYTFTGLPALTIPLRRLDPHWGKRKDGLIAGDILARFLTVIDYERERVSLLDSTAAASLTGERIPVDLVNRFFFVRAELFLHGQVEPVPALLMVDTGLRVTTFCRPFAERLGLAAQSPHTLTGVTGFGIGGVSRGVVGRLRGLRLGALTIDSPVVVFSQDARGALASEDFAGILGADVLSRYRVGLDYAGAQLVLEPGPSAAEPYEFDMSGLRVLMEGDRFERVSIFFVFPDSPAAEAGLQAGDRLLAVDGRPAAEFTRQALRQHLMREGALVTLALERKGKPFSATLRLRRLV